MLRTILVILCVAWAALAQANSVAVSVTGNVPIEQELPSGFANATLAEGPLSGRAFVQGTVLRYWPDQGFVGHDRIALSNASQQPLVVHLIVGDPHPPEVEVIYTTLAALLFALAVVAIFLELAFTMLFNNRLFRTVNWVPGVKTVVAFLGSGLVVWVFGFDIFGEVMRAVSASDEFGRGAGYVSGAITAMLLAGGSGTVFYLYTRLGIRNPFTAGRSGAAERGHGLLNIEVTRAKVGDLHPIGVSLGLDDGTEFLGAIPPGSTRFGGQTGRELAAGVYTLILEGQSDTGTPERLEHTLVITSGAHITVGPLAF